jgi:hypothetical protein
MVAVAVGNVLPWSVPMLAVDLKVRPFSSETSKRRSSPGLSKPPPVGLSIAWLRVGFRGGGSGTRGYGSGGLARASAAAGLACALQSEKPQFRLCSSPRRCLLSLSRRTKHLHCPHWTMSCLRRHRMSRHLPFLRAMGQMVFGIGYWRGQRHESRHNQGCR